MVRDKDLALFFWMLKSSFADFMILTYYFLNMHVFQYKLLCAFLKNQETVVVWTYNYVLNYDIDHVCFCTGAMLVL